MKFLIIAILFGILPSSLLAGEATEGDDGQPPLVNIKQGLIKGKKETSINGKEFYSYMSIPYAEPPLDTLRFADPISSKSWSGILDGTKMPVSCMQYGTFDLLIDNYTSVTLMGKEDCLYLNVFSSEPGNSEALLPVMVFIHGGGFMVGSTQDYPPYAMMNKDIVLVTIQYRLGVFGFLSTEDSEMRGNMGLKDQQLALKWVKGNIESFGGDPDRITIFGQSAGSASVHYQILSPGSAGLFQRAIMMSGAALCPFAANKHHREFAASSGRDFNCSLQLGTEFYRRCMQKVDAHYLLIAASKTPKWGLTPYFTLPRVDGQFISKPPEILVKEGRYNKVDIVAGVMRDEGAFELSIYEVNPDKRRKLNSNFEEFAALSLALQNEKDSISLAKEVYQFYLQREDTTLTEDDRLKLVKMHGDNWFGTCHDMVANFHATDKNINLYLYRLDHFGQHSFLGKIEGFNRTGLVGHGDDLPYLFHGGPFFSENIENKEDLKLREIILDLWTNFASTGNPTPPGTDFLWEKAKSGNFRHLSLTPTPRMADDDYSEIRKFWSSLKTEQNLNLRSNDEGATKQEL